MRSMPTLAFLLMALCPPAARGQWFSFGILGGGAPTNDFHNEGSPDTHTYSTSKDYIVGGMAEVGTGSRLSLEVDALYRPMNFTSFTSTVTSITKAPSNTVVTWEFPLLAKCRFQVPKVQPFMELGPSFRAAGNLNDTAPSNHGVTAGAGVDMRLSRSGISAAMRFTRWAADEVSHSYQPRTNQNQAEFLLGWSFPGPGNR